MTLAADPQPESAVPSRREDFPRLHASVAFADGLGHAHDIETTLPSVWTRHATALAVALLTVSVAAAAMVTWVAATDDAGRPLLNSPATTTAELLCYGSVGALLVARRPDLPFGWLLAAGALANVLLVGLGVPSLAALVHGHGGQLAAWGVALGVVQWVPTAITGLVNTRFPTGAPVTAYTRLLDRLLRYGIVLVLALTYLGDSVRRDLGESGVPLPTRRAIDGSWVTTVGNASVALVPLVILLAALAGIGVIVRCVRASGIEQKQLQWRAAGVALSLILFPLAMTEALPFSTGVLAPVVFVATLAVPVLRYQLWSGPPLSRRRKVGLIVSRRTMVELHEEERRRLRRDLHDGLGPLVTGLKLNLDAAQGRLASEPEKAAEYLDNARQASAEVITGIRGLVHGLRPAALDELGLAGTMRTQLPAIVGGADLQLTVDVDDTSVLPAAVEVALHRTATEAVTNVVRHSSARRCAVSVKAEGADVVLRVDDDGEVTTPWYAGVGLTSMRERAVELGGSFVAGSGPHGFHVRATYPSRPA